MWQDLNRPFYSVMEQLFSEMLAGGKDEVGEIGMVDHQSPHFAAGDSGGKIVVFFDFDRVGKIPGMKPV